MEEKEKANQDTQKIAIKINKCMYRNDAMFGV